ncbi:MAG: PEP-CTERM sorting domain-containing protein [Armatimonadetes bacterium]|nr:PEP-CTERM sorting domain-containing protein [Armatimonadota bacterium]MBS1710607.1 PEP-CTERM sorting domain-containing protein [Armatimonadota bacterium]MBX3108278.1 PEP-CTERM sorting domain-containing protein [Fimbriimonadaceae bacterium]
MKITAIISVFACAAVASAVDVVAPNAFAATEGPGTFSLTTNTAGGRVYQMVIDSSQLTGLVGTNLDGMSFRLNSGATWPPVQVDMSQFDIWVGEGVDPTAITTTVDSNFIGTATQVRSGAISFFPGDFPTGGTPNGFGPNFGFNLGSYAYNGGDLAVLIRFATQTPIGGTAGQAAFDAIAATDTANGYGSLFAAKWQSGSTSTTVNSNGNFIVTKFSGTPVPEPMTLGLLGLGGLAALRRRKK